MVALFLVRATKLLGCSSPESTAGMLAILATLPFFVRLLGGYPLVNVYVTGKSPCLMGKSTINGNFQ
jgi:hypothetical protein